MDRAPRRRKLRVAWTKGGRCSASCVQCCVVQEFLRKNVSKRFTPRWLQVSCGVRIAGSRRQKHSRLSPSTKTRWLRFMLGGRKAQDVPCVDWFRATKRSAQALRCRLNLPSLWHRALAAMYGRAGHAARKDPFHLGHAAIRWRSAEWWEIMKSTGAGSRDQTWRHRRRNWVRSFEHVLGLDCLEAAKLGRDNWKRGKYNFVSKAVRCWGGPSVVGKKDFLENLASIVDAGFI